MWILSPCFSYLRADYWFNWFFFSSPACGRSSLQGLSERPQVHHHHLLSNWSREILFSFSHSVLQIFCYLTWMGLCLCLCVCVCLLIFKVLVHVFVFSDGVILGACFRKFRNQFAMFMI